MAILDDSVSWAAGRVFDCRNSFEELNPTETPFWSMVKKTTKPRHSIFETPFRSRPTPARTAIADSTDVAAADFINYEANKGLLYHRLQKFRVAIMVGDIAQETTVQKGGINNLFLDNTEEAMKAVKTGMEKQFMGLQDSAASTTSGKTTYTLRGVGCNLGLTTITDSATDIAAAAANPAAQRITSRATPSAILESDVRAVINSIRKTSKRPAGTLQGFATTDTKERFSDFVTVGTQSSTVLPLRRFTGSAGDSTISLSVDKYVMGSSSLLLHEHDLLPVEGEDSAASSVWMYMLDMDHWEMPVVRHPRMKTLADEGGGPRGFVDSIVTLVSDNPQRHGSFSYNAP